MKILDQKTLYTKSEQIRARRWEAGDFINLNLNLLQSTAQMQELLQTEVPGGLLGLVLRPNLSILAPDGNLGTPPKARDDLAENSRNFAFYESAGVPLI